MIAIPASVLALEPPVTWSVASLKLLVNKLDTVLPVGLVESSLTLANVATPLATGASLTAVTLIVTVYAEADDAVPSETVYWNRE